MIATLNFTQPVLLGTLKHQHASVDPMPEVLDRNLRAFSKAWIILAENGFDSDSAFRCPLQLCSNPIRTNGLRIRKKIGEL